MVIAADSDGDDNADEGDKGQGGAAVELSGEKLMLGRMIQNTINYAR